MMPRFLFQKASVHVTCPSPDDEVYPVERGPDDVRHVPILKRVVREAGDGQSLGEGHSVGHDSHEHHQDNRARHVGLKASHDLGETRNNPQTQNVLSDSRVSNEEREPSQAGRSPSPTTSRRRRMTTQFQERSRKYARGSKIPSAFGVRT